jgi:hypothetical protein
VNIIGINGFKRSGKGETAAAIDVLMPHLTVKSVGFADKLKVLAARTLGFADLSEQECIDLMDEAKEHWTIDIRRNYDLALDPYSPIVQNGITRLVTQLTGRQYLQNLGNHARQVFGDTFWIDQVLPNPAQYDAEDKSDRYHELLDPMYPGIDILCVTDVRYPNEAERVKALGGVVWEVLRPGTGSDGHASEQPLPASLVDWQIHNDGDLDDLKDQVADAIMETL